MLINKKTTLSILFYSFLVGLSSCSKSDSGPETPPGPTIIPESAFCTKHSTYAVEANLTGTATFSKRGLAVETSSNTVTRLTLSSPISVNLPIRFAEIQVINSNNEIVQCGQTNELGQLKALDGVSNLRIPAIDGTYTVSVLARSYHDFVVPVGKNSFKSNFSVKEDIYSNTVYKLQTTINVVGTTTQNVSFNATALESTSTKIEGGAFNIYNDIITSYEYLANNTGTQDLTCLNTKLSSFWKAGFNPNQYIYPNNDAGSLGTVSFYLREDKELYINGGRLGSVSDQDTDHFDDSVIIHELGHHIENVCGTMESPGGSHNGAARIDPRLAWSEGWGNYFGTHVIKNKLNQINPDLVSLLPNSEWLYYFDSEGYSDNSSANGFEYIRINLARIGSANTTETLHTSTGTGSMDFDLVSSTVNPGEGHFREVAISRALFKATNSCQSPFPNCANQDNFSDIWKSFEKNSTGMGQSIYPFRSSIRLLERFKTIQGGSLSGPLNTIFNSDEAMQLNGDSNYTSSGYLIWPTYGIKLVPSATSCNLKIKPKSNIGTSTKSDQRFSNHFYYLDPSTLSGVTSINLSSTKVTGITLDIDALIFKESYKYNEDCINGTCTKSTNDTVIASNRSSSSNKTISLATLSSGQRYLLNIRAYVSTSVSSPTEYIYILTDQNGGFLCPSNSF